MSTNRTSRAQKSSQTPDDESLGIISEHSGRSIREMLEAELVRVCVKWIRRGESESEAAVLKGQIKAYSHCVLILIDTYHRGSEKARKEIVAEAMAKAKHLERVFNERRKTR